MGIAPLVKRISSWKWITLSVMGIVFAMAGALSLVFWQLRPVAIQAMVSDSWVVITTLLSLGSAIEIGFVAVYLESAGALFASLILSASCVALIVHGYWRSLDLLVSHRRLRERVKHVLVLRLQASIREAFDEAATNAVVANKLDHWGATRIGSDKFSPTDYVTSKFANTSLQ